MKHVFSLLFCVSFFLPAESNAKSIAVLEFRGVGVKAEVLNQLSDQVRYAAVQLLPKNQLFCDDP